MSTLTPTRPAPTSTRYHRDQNGFEIDYLQEYDEGKAYLHYIEEWSPSQDEAILTGAAITSLCGKSWVPAATDYIGPHSNENGRLICPKCYQQTLLRR